MAATRCSAIVSQILDAVPQISAIHPYLLTAPVAALRRPAARPRRATANARGCWSTLAYVAVFGSLAWARLTTRDVSS